MESTPQAGPGRPARRACALAFALLASVTRPALATDAGPDDLTSLSLEQLANVQVVYAASRYEQRTADAPASVTIVTSAEFERFGARTLAEVLDHVRGLWVTSDHNYTYLGVRGFGEPGDENRRVLLMVNGHRLNEPVFDYAGLGADFVIPLEAVDRIEIIRGPGSSVFGTNALFAVIHVITREPADAARFEVRAGGGSERTGEGGLSFLTPLAGGGALEGSASWSDSQGPDWYFPEFDDGSPGAGHASGLDGGRAAKGFARLRWQSLSVQAGWAKVRDDIPTAAFGTQFGLGGDDATRTWEEHAFADALWQLRPDERTDVKIRASANLSNYEGQYAYEGANPGDPPNVFHDDGRARWFTVGGQLATRRLADHTFVTGAEWHGDARLDQRAWDESGVFTDVSRTGSKWGVYAQDEWSATSLVRLSAGVRFDHHGAFGGRVSPRVAGVFAPHAGTRVKTTYGQAYRAPSSYELDYEGGGNKAAGELDPEIVDTWEAALEQGLGAHASLVASVYRFDVRDLLGQQLDPADSLIVYRNAGRVRAEGVELELRSNLASGWELRGAWGFQRAKDRDSGLELANAPQHLVHLTLLTPTWRSWDAAARVRGMSERRTITDGRVAPHATLDLALRCRLPGGRVRLTTSVSNVTDAVYADPGAEQHLQDAIPQRGREWRTMLSLSPTR